MKFLLILGLLSLISCKSNKYDFENLPNRQLIFGNGGGFTGVETNYILLENGQIFMRGGLKKTKKALQSIKRKDAKSLFNRCEQLGLDTLSINAPGNSYHFIEYHKSQGTVNKIVWGSSNYKVSEALLEFNKDLNTLSRQQ